MAKNKTLEALQEKNDALTLQNILQQLEYLSKEIPVIRQKLDAMEYQPPYIKFLIDEGYILPNKNVVKSLDDVACAICDKFPKIPVTKTLLSQFLHNGKQYSSAAIEQAITLANTRCV